MKIIPLIAFSLVSCASRPVTYKHWVDCNVVCLPLEVLEACDNAWYGKGCKCEDGQIIWLDEMAIEQ